MTSQTPQTARAALRAYYVDRRLLFILNGPSFLRAQILLLISGKHREVFALWDALESLLHLLAMNKMKSFVARPPTLRPAWTERTPQAQCLMRSVQRGRLP